MSWNNFPGDTRHLPKPKKIASLRAVARQSLVGWALPTITHVGQCPTYELPAVIYLLLFATEFLVCYCNDDRKM